MDAGPGRLSINGEPAGDVSGDVVVSLPARKIHINPADLPPYAKECASIDLGGYPVELDESVPAGYVEVREGRKVLGRFELQGG